MELGGGIHAVIVPKLNAVLFGEHLTPNVGLLFISLREWQAALSVSRFLSELGFPLNPHAWVIDIIVLVSAFGRVFEVSLRLHMSHFQVRYRIVEGLVWC